MKMISLTRGMAVLALLCLAPCARAVTVTETFSSTTPYPNFISTGGGSVLIPAYEGAAPLTGVLISVDLLVSGVVSHYNIYEEPSAFGKGANLEGYGLLFSAPGVTVGEQPRFGASTGDRGSIVLGPTNRSDLYTFDLQSSFLLTVSDPMELQLLASSIAPRFSILASVEHGGYGGAIFEATARVTTYYNVPDAGWTIYLAAIALAGMCFIHHGRSIKGC
jgi:hypothetical protein